MTGLPCVISIMTIEPVPTNLRPTSPMRKISIKSEKLRQAVLQLRDSKYVRKFIFTTSFWNMQGLQLVLGFRLEFNKILPSRKFTIDPALRFKNTEFVNSIEDTEQWQASYPQKWSCMGRYQLAEIPINLNDTHINSRSPKYLA